MLLRVLQLPVLLLLLLLLPQIIRAGEGRAEGPARPDHLPRAGPKRLRNGGVLWSERCVFTMRRGPDRLRSHQAAGSHQVMALAEVAAPPDHRLAVMLENGTRPWR